MKQNVIKWYVFLMLMNSSLSAMDTEQKIKKIKIGIYTLTLSRHIALAISDSNTPFNNIYIVGAGIDKIFKNLTLDEKWKVYEAVDKKQYIFEDKEIHGVARLILNSKKN